MPLSKTAENPLNETHRKKLKDAQRVLEDARANCESCNRLGIDTADQMDRINAADEWILAILREYFGE